MAGKVLARRPPRTCRVGGLGSASARARSAAASTASTKICRAGRVNGPRLAEQEEGPRATEGEGETAGPDAAGGGGAADGRGSAEAGEGREFHRSASDDGAGVRGARRGRRGRPVWEPVTLLTWTQGQSREVEPMAMFVVSLEDPEGTEFPMHEALQAWATLSLLAFSTWANRVWWVRRHDRPQPSKMSSASATVAARTSQ